jgi:hypothetical protein
MNTLVNRIKSFSTADLGLNIFDNIYYYLWFYQKNICQKTSDYKLMTSLLHTQNKAKSCKNKKVAKFF